MSEWTLTFKKNFFFKLKKIIEVQSQIERTFISVHDISKHMFILFLCSVNKESKENTFGS